MPETTFDIFETRDRYIAIHDLRSRDILDHLTQGPASPEALAAAVDAEPSETRETIESLESRGFVSREDDGTILLTCQHIGASYIEKDDLRAAVKDYVDRFA